MDTFIGASHKILFRGELKRAIDCVDKEKGIKKITFHIDNIYNLLFEKEGINMVANNIPVVTLYKGSQYNWEYKPLEFK